MIRLLIPRTTTTARSPTLLQPPALRDHDLARSGPVDPDPEPVDALDVLDDAVALKP